METRPIYFTDPSIDTLLRIVLALGAEVFVLRDRQATLEKLLEEKGTIWREEIERYTPTDAEADALRQERDAFMARLFRSLSDQRVE